MEEKHSFEPYAATFGVKIQKYHAENVTFNTHIFKESVIASNLTISFSGVDAHQNRIAERMIKTFTYRAQTILLNTIICWIDVITTEVWPYAIKLAIVVGNNCPYKYGIAAIDCFASTKGYSQVKQFQTFRLPCFILDTKLYQKKYIPKWTPQSR